MTGPDSVSTPTYDVNEIFPELAPATFEDHGTYVVAFDETDEKPAESTDSGSRLDLTYRTRTGEFVEMTAVSAHNDKRVTMRITDRDGQSVNLEFTDDNDFGNIRSLMLRASLTANF